MRCTYVRTMKCTANATCTCNGPKYMVPGIYYQVHIKYFVPGTWYIFRGGLAEALDADQPTRTLTRTRTRTLWGDLCLDAVDGGCAFQKSRTRICIQCFQVISAVCPHNVNYLTSNPGRILHSILYSAFSFYTNTYIQYLNQVVAILMALPRCPDQFFIILL